MTRVPFGDPRKARARAQLIDARDPERVKPSNPAREGRITSTIITRNITRNGGILSNSYSNTTPISLNFIKIINFYKS